MRKNAVVHGKKSYGGLNLNCEIHLKKKLFKVLTKIRTLTDSKLLIKKNTVGWKSIFYTVNKNKHTGKKTLVRKKTIDQIRLSDFTFSICYALNSGQVERKTKLCFIHFKKAEKSIILFICIILKSLYYIWVKKLTKMVCLYLCNWVILLFWTTFIRNIWSEKFLEKFPWLF